MYKCLSTLRPVSYTHLDVYKRQVDSGVDSGILSFLNGKFVIVVITQTHTPPHPPTFPNYKNVPITVLDMRAV